ncbi:MAG: hypothetical protein WCI74_16525 [Actinomycetes bacterium]
MKRATTSAECVLRVRTNVMGPLRASALASFLVGFDTGAVNVRTYGHTRLIHQVTIKAVPRAGSVGMTKSAWSRAWSNPRGLLGTTIQSSNLELQGSAGVTSVFFAWSGAGSVTGGQGPLAVTYFPPAPPSGVQPSSSGTITVSAGRQGSKPPATWFQTNASVAVPTDAAPLQSNPTWPSSLNFAFTGTLVINGNSYPVTVGQGHYESTNNWWIGGPGWNLGPPPHHSSPSVITPDRQFSITDCTNNSNYCFAITPNS